MQFQWRLSEIRVVSTGAEADPILSALRAELPAFSMPHTGKAKAPLQND
jgi:hypothetical protein